MDTLVDDELETDSIYQAAFYNLSGCEYKRKKRVGHKVYFIFTNPGGTMKEMRDSYFSGKAKVSVFDYTNELRRFKELLFD